MRAYLFPIFIFVIAFIVFSGCSIPEDSDPASMQYVGGGNEGSGDDEGRSSSTDENNHMAILEYYNPHFENPGTIEKFSEAKVAIIETRFLWGPNNNPDIINSIKALNPDIKILGYISAHDTWLRWSESNMEDEPYQASWYQAVRPYWSYTTTGDTMMSWKGKVLVNVLDENCRNAMIDVLAEQWTANSNVSDGVYSF